MKRRRQEEHDEELDPASKKTKQPQPTSKTTTNNNNNAGTAHFEEGVERGELRADRPSSKEIMNFVDTQEAGTDDDEEIAIMFAQEEDIGLVDILDTGPSEKMVDAKFFNLFDDDFDDDDV